jgi:iron complex outermembrane receptor protein
MDARAHYRIDASWSAAVGIDNLNNDQYFLYHPFPQRTFVMELHYAQ